MLILILAWVAFGLVVGLVARVVFPGPQPMNVGATIALGVAGSSAFGAIANAVFGGRLFALHAAGFIGSLVGALLLLVLMAAASRTRHAA